LHPPLRWTCFMITWQPLLLLIILASMITLNTWRLTYTWLKIKSKLKSFGSIHEVQRRTDGYFYKSHIKQQFLQLTTQVAHWRFTCFHLRRVLIWVVNWESYRDFVGKNQSDSREQSEILSIRRGTSFSPSSTSNILLVCDRRDGVHRLGK